MSTPAKARRVEIRVSDDDRALAEEAAAALGQSLSEFMRQAGRARAEEVLGEQNRIVLNDAEARRFLDALDDPGRFEPGLRRLVERGRAQGR